MKEIANFTFNLSRYWLKCFLIMCVLVGIKGELFFVALRIWADFELTMYSDGLWQLIPIQAAVFTTVHVANRNLPH